MIWIAKQFAVAMAMALSGCAASSSHCHLRCEAMRADAPASEILRLDYPGWQLAKPYPFRPASNSESRLQESGRVRFLWSKTHLFVLGEMEDSDIVQEGCQNQQRLYAYGDVMEVFIKPAGQPSYWELHAAPNQLESSFFFPSRGRILPSCFTGKAMDGLACSVSLDGTLNNCKDRDKGWRAVMAIPLSEIERSCGQLDFSSSWSVQVARYNYSCYLEKPELSHIGTATTGAPDFHHFPSYAELEFAK